MTQSAKLTLISDDKQFLFLRHGRKELILGGQLFAKFPRIVYGRIDLTAEFCFNLAEGRDDITETYFAYKHQVHIARTRFLAPCNRTVHERQFNLILKGSKTFEQNIWYPGRLRQDALQLSEDCVLPIRLVVGLTPLADAVNEAGLSELLKFALRSPYAGSRTACDFAEVKLLVGVAVEKDKDRPSALATVSSATFWADRR